MTAEITFSNLVWNKSLRGFFFREQSERHFNEVVDAIMQGPEEEESLNELFENYFSTVDELEEYFYEEDADTIIADLREYGFTPALLIVAD